ncbi:hypothetical protein NDU88_005074 [Pleurodeles waltl]|uniref:Uncharacterized protein n=1 Tax=Pleurodeles waltl TaxID=8319 RepID=A0AAV7SKR5_PLEWA|nr:hypothetical protein NDU88_005074 [Pleurodeles waltl]
MLVEAGCPGFADPVEAGPLTRLNQKSRRGGPTCGLFLMCVPSDAAARCAVTGLGEKSPRGRLPRVVWRRGNNPCHLAGPELWRVRLLSGLPSGWCT